LKNSKYGKYVMSEPGMSKQNGPISVNASIFDEVSCDIVFNVCTEIGKKDPGPHKHDVDEYLYFLGGNPTNFRNFQAEIEVCLGWEEDQETHVITSSTVIYIPKGLVHMPWRFTRVDEPIIVGHILLAPTFKKYQPDEII
jgi:hypothetical protein